MKAKHTINLLMAFFLSLAAYSQNHTKIGDKRNGNILQKEQPMKTYVIEREIPNAGELTPEELKGISKKSNEVLSAMGKNIEWQHSYVTDDKVYCVYKALSEELLREHAQKGGFPINQISELSTTIDPSTGKD